MKKSNELKKLIGDLEVMAAASEAGIVLTEEMSISCSVTLMKAVTLLKGSLNEGKFMAS